MTTSQKRERRRGGIKWIVPHLLLHEWQGAFIDLIQALQESEEDVYRNFTCVPSSILDWLFELIIPIIIKEDTVFLWSISPSEQLPRDEKALFLLVRSYDTLRCNC